MRSGGGQRFLPRLALALLSPTRAMSTVLPGRFVVATNGVASASELTSKEFLLSHPPGAYTTARTCARAARLFEWTTHVERTAASAAAMINDQAGSAAPAPSARSSLLASIGNAPSLRPKLDATVSAAVRQYCSTYGREDELKVTILVTWPSATSGAAACEGSTEGSPAAEGSLASAEGSPAAEGSIACHIAPLPPLPKPPVKVEVRGAPRANAAAKDSSWVADRQSYSNHVAITWQSCSNHIAIAKQA